jgi:hypothetical protein
MRHPLTRLGPVLWAVCACLLLLPNLTAADPSFAVDFDGDGQPDTVWLDQRRPSVIRVWLSASGATQVLRSRRPLQNVTATDLDGDRRPELIASDSQARLHVWTPRAKGFRRFHHARLVLPKGLNAPKGHRVDGRNREPEEVFTGGAFAPPELTRTLPLVPPDHRAVASASHDSPVCPVSASFAPFSPRPPPTRSLLAACLSPTLIVSRLL